MENPDFRDNSVPQPPATLEEIFHGLTIRSAWGTIDESTRRKLVAFWLEQNALHDRLEAERRVNDVVCLAFDSDHNVVAVGSVIPGELGKHGAYWFYRTFIRPDQRRLGLVARMFRLAARHLQTVGNDQAPLTRGMAVIVENARLEHEAARRALRAEGLVRIGVTQHGRSIWKLDF